jgi:hypothetical protein
MYNDKLRESLNGHIVIAGDDMQDIPLTLSAAKYESETSSMSRNQGGGTYVVQYPTETSMSINRNYPVHTRQGVSSVLQSNVGVAASCAYQAFFPPGIQTPFAYVRAWFKFTEATAVDHRNVDSDGDLIYDAEGISNEHDNIDTGSSLHNGRRLRRQLESVSTTAPPNVQHSVHFKFGVQ